MEPTLKQLKVFLVLAETLSFSEAAHKLFTSQQAVSATIKQLEEVFGVELFVRSTRTVALSEAGRELQTRVRPMLVQLDETLATYVTEWGRSARVIRVGMPPGGAGDLTQPLLGLLAEIPNSFTELRRVTWELPYAGLLQRDTDIALIWTDVRDTSIRGVRIGSEPMMAAISAKHELASEKAIDLEALLRLPFVQAREADPEWNRVWLLEDYRSTPMVLGAKVDSFTEELEAVAAGLGVSIMPATVTRLYARNDVAFLEVPEIPNAPLNVCWRSDHPLSREFGVVAERMRGLGLTQQATD